MPSEPTLLVLDTSVIIAKIRGALSEERFNRAVEGRVVLISPVTYHELRRGVKPGSAWEKRLDTLLPESSVLVEPPSTREWLIASDLLRTHFPRLDKMARALLQNDALIAVTARRYRARLWARDQGFEELCRVLDVPLLAI